MKPLLGLLVAFLLAGCASASVQTYRPAGHVGPAWEIEGYYKSTTSAIRIRVNNQDVIKGRLAFFQRRAELAGTYENRRLTASCVETPGLFWTGVWTTVQCIVFVDGERAATLQW